MEKLKEYDEMKERMMEALKNTFRPEFINRIDDIIVFHKLTERIRSRSQSLCLAVWRRGCMTGKLTYLHKGCCKTDGKKTA